MAWFEQLNGQPVTFDDEAMSQDKPCQQGNMLILSVMQDQGTRVAGNGKFSNYQTSTRRCSGI